MAADLACRSRATAAWVLRAITPDGIAAAYTLNQTPEEYSSICWPLQMKAAAYFQRLQLPSPFEFSQIPSRKRVQASPSHWGLPLLPDEAPHT
jgi:hypothetical protein